MGQFVTLREAAQVVHDGMTVAFGGMTIYRRPVSFALELIRRPNPPRDLTIFAFTNGYETDLLIGAGCVSAVRSCYFGLEGFGLAPMFTEKAGLGEVSVIEETEASIGNGLRAAAANIGFMPSTAWIGTELPTLRPDVKTVIDPYTGETLTAFPAIRPDIAVIHALEADRWGNIAINQNIGIDQELVSASQTVIVTYEQLVAELTKSADRAILPAPVSDFLAYAPSGAWPTSCYPLYPFDGEELMSYIEACNAREFDKYLAAKLGQSASGNEPSVE